MKGDRVRLSGTLVKAATTGAGDHFLWDSEVVGFGLKITAGGARSYVVQYRFEGRSRRYTIGPHGSPWTVETARAQAKVLLGQAAAGEDPQAAKCGARKDLTVAQVCDLYLAEGMATCKPKSIAAARSSIENHIKPLLGTRRANKIARQDVQKLLVAVADGKTRRVGATGRRRGRSIVRGGKGAANKAVGTLSAVMGFAVGRQIRPDNPAFRVRRYAGRKLSRFLSPAEVVRLGDVLMTAETLGVELPQAIAAIRALLLSGCRKSEVLTLQRAFVDRHHRCFRLPDSKTGEKIVHVGAEVIALIDAIPEVTGNPYVFVGEDGTGHLVNLQKVWSRIRHAADLDDVRIHDLRHAFASFGVSRGDSLPIIGALLGHASAKTTEIYAHLADHPVKEAAVRISAEIARLLGLASMAQDEAPPAPAPPLAAAEIDRVSQVLGEVRRARWLDTPAAAEQLGNTVGTLQTWRWMGVGPPYRKIGRRVVYAEAELEAWKARQSLAA